MPKSEQIKNRSPLNSNRMESSQRPKKPRKVVKKTMQVSPEQIGKPLSTQVNFYQTLPQIPTYHLSKQQMNSDPIFLLNNLQQKYSQFGGVKLVINEAWNAPFTFRYVDKQITTRIQLLQKLKQGKAFEQKVRAYRISAYQAMANTFAGQYRYRTEPRGSSEQSIRQDEYWNLITDSKCNYLIINFTDQKKLVTVQYAADLSTSIYGSGFPQHYISNYINTDFQYQTNYFNLNNISKSPSSLLSICQKRKEKISGISYPWLYMGMMFATFCWHVEDLFLNSLNYNHKGATKTWYIVPARDKEKFDQFVERKFEGNSKKKNILEKIVLMIDPKELVAEGINVYKANQRARQFVCTFIKAYHAGFSHGFNVGQAINFLSTKSLKPIEQAQKYYSFLQHEKGFKPKPLVLSKQWLVYENIVQNKHKKLSEQERFCLKMQYDKIIKNEGCYLRDELVNKKKLLSIDQCPQRVNIIPQSAKYEKLSCQYCKNYIYLSAIKCKKCGILCESHVNRCQCDRDAGGFEICIREPNKDRKKNFGEYPVIMEAIKKFQASKQQKGEKHWEENKIKQKQTKSSRSLSLVLDKRLSKELHHQAKSIRRSKPKRIK